MAGGGTGGHVIPALAVARELKHMGHEAIFVGTERGVEARLVPAAGFPLELIRIGGLKRVGATQRMASIVNLATGTAGQWKQFGRQPPDAIFSMGGYVAGPPVLAGLLRRIPIAVMEPNAVPGLTNRYIARFATKALVTFPETGRFFPKGRTEVTGVPVRYSVFAIPEKRPGDVFTVLITGGSQGSRTLNQAARAAWPLFGGMPVRFVHQTGAAMFDELKRDFAASGTAGEILPFIENMPGAFTEADLIICRAGANAVAELAASGKPAVLAPFPFAADQHQKRNAEAFVKAGAALMIEDKDFTGVRLFETVSSFMKDRKTLDEMGRNARKLARPGAARRAAEILVEIAKKH